jgi:multidrug efflux pump subunit AcrA (membrane-fusion protein)
MKTIRIAVWSSKWPCTIPGGQASRRADDCGGSDGASPSQDHEIPLRRLIAATVSVGLIVVLASVIAPSQGASPQENGAVKAGEKKAPAPQGGATPASADGKSATAKVEKGPFKIDVVVSGVFEAQRMTEVSIRPKAWAMPLLVERAVELGTPVKKGDILLELDREKIDKAIEEAEVENTLSELALKQATEELPILEKALPVDLAAAERTKAQADEDLKRFLEIDKPHSIKSADFSVKRSNEYLEYSKEELRQLEKMYRSKDLTEETEEIILRRQRFQVENGEFALKEAELHRNQTLKVDLPRQEERAHETAIKHSIDLEKARATLPLNVSQKRLALAKLKHDIAKGAERLADLRHDRDAMTVHAPADGLVYFGRCERGHWTTSAAISSKLHKGGNILPDEIFMTIVAPRPLDVRASVDEKDLAALTQRAELKGSLTSTFDPGRRLPARLASVLPVPQQAGKFEAVIAVDVGEDIAALKPGMACTVKFVPYRKNDALTVPSSAVFEDDSENELYHFVYLAKANKDAKYPKRRVTTGKTAHGKTEISAGLAEGDEILTAKP